MRGGVPAGACAGHAPPLSKESLREPWNRSRQVEPGQGKEESPVAGKVNHDLGMFVGTKGEERKAANTDLFVPA